MFANKLACQRRIAPHDFISRPVFPAASAYRRVLLHLYAPSLESQKSSTRNRLGVSTTRLDFDIYMLWFLQKRN